VRRLISVVSQNTYLFSASVRENLLVAARTPVLMKWCRLRSTPRSTISSNLYPRLRDVDRGAGMRLSVASPAPGDCRALLKNALCWCLDEATANLDAITERQVLGLFIELMADRLALVLTHRLVGLQAMKESCVGSGPGSRARASWFTAGCGGLYRCMWICRTRLSRICYQLLRDDLAPPP